MFSNFWVAWLAATGTLLVLADFAPGLATGAAYALFLAAVLSIAIRQKVWDERPTEAGLPA